MVDMMMFGYEIGTMIKNEEIKALVVKALEKAPEATWNRPASSTIKYHPLNEKGGVETVYQHTKRVVAMAKMLLSNDCFNGNYSYENENEFVLGEPLTQDDKDILIASAILHDSCKYGFDDPANEKYTKFEHPVLVKELLPSDNGGYWDRIAEAVSSHSGTWNTNKYSDVVLPTPKNKVAILLHQADWLASRKNLVYYPYNAYKPRTLFARLREAIVGWWTDRKINRMNKK